MEEMLDVHWNDIAELNCSPLTMGTNSPSGLMILWPVSWTDMQQDLYLPFGHVYASYGLGEGEGEADAETDAETEADDEGDMRAFEIDGVGDGFTLVTGMAVAARIIARLVMRVVRCMVGLVWFGLLVWCL
jgi:hypothetical protein